MKMKIAIDGPSGAGKSTIAKKLSEILKIPYLDTGAIFRALAYALLEMQIDLKNESEVDQALPQLVFDFENDRIILDDVDITAHIRTDSVSIAASTISRYPGVRAYVHAIEARLSQEAVIMDGRDIGTVVLPDADFKFLLRRRIRCAQEGVWSNSDSMNLPMIPCCLRFASETSRMKTEPKLPSKSTGRDSDSHRQCNGGGNHCGNSYAYERYQMNLWYRLIRSLIWLITGVLFRVEVAGKEHLPNHHFVLVANHYKFWDPIILARIFPEELYFMAKKELFEISICGALLRSLNAFPVDRKASDLTAIRRATSIVAEGNSLVIFPEGTRVKEKKRSNFKEGAALIASRVDVPLLPVTIEGSYRVFGKLRVTIHESIEIDSFAEGLNRKELRKEILDRAYLAIYGNEGFDQ